MISSKTKYDYYLPEVILHNHSYPFGMQMPDRKSSTDEYRYGFQGQEKDDELKGEGNSLNYEYRMHDPRIGRFFAIDPLASEYPHNSPYAFSENRVLDAVELEGLEAKVIWSGIKSTTNWLGGGGQTMDSHHTEWTYNNESEKWDVTSSNSNSKTHFPALFDFSKITGMQDGGTLTMHLNSYDGEMDFANSYLNYKYLDWHDFTEKEVDMSFSSWNESVNSYNQTITDRNEDIMNRLETGLSLMMFTVGPGSMTDIGSMGSSSFASKSYSSYRSSFSFSKYLGLGSYSLAKRPSGLLSLGFGYTLVRKPTITEIKLTLGKVHDIVGGSMPKGQIGKFGSPQRGSSVKGYRLDPPHLGRSASDPENYWHINYWDYSNGKRGSGGISGAFKIGF